MIGTIRRYFIHLFKQDTFIINDFFMITVNKDNGNFILFLRNYDNSSLCYTNINNIKILKKYDSVPYTIFINHVLKMFDNLLTELKINTDKFIVTRSNFTITITPKNKKDIEDLDRICNLSYIIIKRIIYKLTADIKLIDDINKNKTEIIKHNYFYDPK